MLESPHSNNPLQASRSNLELTMDFDLETDEHEGYLQVIRQEIERLGEITRRQLRLPWPTTALPLQRSAPSASSIPFSPPNRKALGSASPSATALSTDTAGPSAWRTWRVIRAWFSP